MNVTSVRGLATISLSRARVATRVGVSRAWTTAVEAVKVSVEFDLFVGLLHPGWLVPNQEALATSTRPGLSV